MKSWGAGRRRRAPSLKALRTNAALRKRVEDKRRPWNGLCPSNLHGLDYRGQPCDLCRRSTGGVP